MSQWTPPPQQIYLNKSGEKNCSYQISGRLRGEISVWPWVRDELLHIPTRAQLIKQKHMGTHKNGVFVLCSAHLGEWELGKNVSNSHISQKTQSYQSSVIRKQCPGKISQVSVQTFHWGGRGEPTPGKGAAQPWPSGSCRHLVRAAKSGQNQNHSTRTWQNHGGSTHTSTLASHALLVTWKGPATGAWQVLS
jgi:hypothetical protein